MYIRAGKHTWTPWSQMRNWRTQIGDISLPYGVSAICPIGVRSLHYKVCGVDMHSPVHVYLSHV